MDSAIQARHTDRARPAETAWAPELSKDAPRANRTAAWAGAAEIPETPVHALQAADLQPAPGRSCGPRKTCRPQIGAARGARRARHRRRRGPWHGTAQADPAACRVFPCRETDSAAWQFRARLSQSPG